MASAKPTAMSRFAFIIHPLNRSHQLRILQKLRLYKSFLSAAFLRNHDHRFSPIPALTLPFHSKDEKNVVCDVILCPLLPGQMVEDEKRAITTILQSIDIAKERGARLVGLGGFTSIVGNGGLEVATRSSLPVTSGNTYTASSVVKSIIKCGKLMDIDFSRSHIAFIGATGDIGSACARQLAALFGTTTLVARSESQLERLAESLRPKCGRVHIEKRISKAVANADVIITATSALTTLIESDDLKKGAIVCDVSYPANIAKEIWRKRPDILVFEGGIVSSRQFISQIQTKSPFWEFNPHGGMHACFAEVLLLALEEKFVNFSIGRGNISSQKMSEIERLAEKYVFELTLFWNGIGFYDDHDIIKIARARTTVLSRNKNTRLRLKECGLKWK